MSLTGRMQALKQKLTKRLYLHEQYQAVFRTPQGQEVLSHIARVGFITKTTFVAGDPHLTAMNEGKRVLALSILKFVNQEHAELVKQVEQAMEQDD